MRTGMGISIGSETSGGIADVHVHSNQMGLCGQPPPGCNTTGYNSTDLPACTVGMCGWNAGLHIKTTLARGGTIERVLYENNTVSENNSFIGLLTNYQTGDKLPVGYPATVIKDIAFIGNTGAKSGVHLGCRYAPFTFPPLFGQWGKNRLCVLEVGYHYAGAA